MLGFIVIEPFIIREVEFFDQDQDHDHDYDDLLRAHPCSSVESEVHSPSSPFESFAPFVVNPLSLCVLVVLSFPFFASLCAFARVNFSVLKPSCYRQRKI